MSRALNAHILFQTKKRSFNLAWGSWAGILAVMTAVGAALTGSQILLMRSRPVSWIVFSYPSLPRSGGITSEQLDKSVPAIFLGAQGTLLGRLRDIAAPQEAEQLIYREGKVFDQQLLFRDMELLMRKHHFDPVRFVAVGESSRRVKELSLSEWASIAHVVEQLNQKIFSVSLRPTLVPIELAKSH